MSMCFPVLARNMERPVDDREDHPAVPRRHKRRSAEQSQQTNRRLVRKLLFASTDSRGGDFGRGRDRAIYQGARRVPGDSPTPKGGHFRATAANPGAPAWALANPPLNFF